MEEAFWQPRTLDIGFAGTKLDYRGRGALKELYNYIFETANVPPIAAKSFFVSTNQRTFTESLITQMDHLFSRNPPPINSSPHEYNKFIRKAFLSVVVKNLCEFKVVRALNMMRLFKKHLKILRQAVRQ